MEVIKIALSFISILLGAYIPIWVVVQSQKKSQTKEMIGEIKSLTTKFTEISSKHEVKLEHHEKRLDKLEK